MVKKHSLIVAILILLALAVSGCNLPARNAGPVSTPTAASTIPPAITVIPKDPDSTPAAATATLPAPSPSPTSTTFEGRDPQALIASLQIALGQKNTSFFAHFATENLNYVDYIEGGQPVERAKFLDDLTARLDASSPGCTQYGTYEQTLQIWTSGWDPLWQIDQVCYQGCSPLNPPHTSQNAAFFFEPNANGVYELNTVWLNDDNLWTSVYGVKMHACDEPYQAGTAATAAPETTPTVFTCPGAPAPQLKSGSRAIASDQSSTPSRVRSAPGTNAQIIGLIQPRQVVDVLDGPQCANGYVWWQVRLMDSGLTGWTAEGYGSNYWLQPCTVARCGQP